MSLDITPEDVYMHQLQGNSDEERESNLRTRRRLAALLAPSVKGDAKNTAAADPEPSKASSKPVARKAGGTGKRGRKRANAAFAQAALGDPDQIYEIERIVDVRWAGNPNEAATDRDYLVSWKGYPNSNNSWEPETSFVSSLPLQPWQDKWQELPKTSNSAASSVGGGASALSSSSHPANDKNSNAGKRARTVRSKLGGGGGGGGGGDVDSGDDSGGAVSEFVDKASSTRDGDEGDGNGGGSDYEGGGDGEDEDDDDGDLVIVGGGDDASQVESGGRTCHTSQQTVKRRPRKQKLQHETQQAASLPAPSSTSSASSSASASLQEANERALAQLKKLSFLDIEARLLRRSVAEALLREDIAKGGG
eukprot:CAMPEP_0171857652 /NCGR_PEP_ID=MMETSP0992-20121227/24824_1 /TAXON_ID=483369 /ORGANISM="non described non described, Strain CCMP2098" /LENGTH=363 /DNA_ID=CAMNT_0012478943 /DNA_START=209 /DNA_END=1296 /DNA_ORIENTATION=-